MIVIRTLALLIASVLCFSCASGGQDTAANTDLQIELFQELSDRSNREPSPDFASKPSSTRQAPSQYLYLVLVSNISGDVLSLDSISLEPIGAGEMSFRNANTTPRLVMEPGEQGEFRIWADVQLEGTFYDPEGPATMRIVVSYSVEGTGKVISNVHKVKRVSDNR